MPTLTILSNGYGEDTIGAKLARVWQDRQPHWKIQAYPIVDAGDAYESLNIPILGERKVMPSGGLLMHHPDLFWQDIRAGILSMTVKQLLHLSQLHTDALIVVGDVYALALAQLVKTQRFFVQSLVSAYHQHDHPALNRQTMERISRLERYWMHRGTESVYVRDAFTAQWLQQNGIQHAKALGNPMMDDLIGDSLEHTLLPDKKTPKIALLAGTRSYAPLTLAKMINALETWGVQEKLTAWVAWTRSTEEITSLFSKWEYMNVQARGLRASYRYDNATLHILDGRFSAIIQAADIVWGTAGTANEQAAGLGKPVLSFVLEPHYTKLFLENQQRLLDTALMVSTPSQLVGDSRSLLADKVRYREASLKGQQRMGDSGGSQRIVHNILEKLRT